MARTKKNFLQQQYLDFWCFELDLTALLLFMELHTVQGLIIIPFQSETEYGDYLVQRVAEVDAGDSIRVRYVDLRYCV